jgi:hypothetical protein
MNPRSCTFWELGSTTFISVENTELSGAHKALSEFGKRIKVRRWCGGCTDYLHGCLTPHRSRSIKHGALLSKVALFFYLYFFSPTILLLLQLSSFLSSPQIFQITSPGPQMPGRCRATKIRHDRGSETSNTGCVGEFLFRRQ